MRAVEFLILPSRHFTPCILRWQRGDYIFASCRSKSCEFRRADPPLHSMYAPLAKRGRNFASGHSRSSELPLLIINLRSAAAQSGRTMILCRAIWRLTTSGAGPRCPGKGKLQIPFAVVGCSFLIRFQCFEAFCCVDLVTTWTGPRCPGKGKLQMPFVVFGCSFLICYLNLFERGCIKQYHSWCRHSSQREDSSKVCLY